jgi:DNA-binding beta-propeller fold protein YncE
VSDIKDELQRLVEDGARSIRPLAVDDVIRIGDSRRRRIVPSKRRERTRGRGLPTTSARPARRWPGWAAPLGAAAAVAALVAAVTIVSGAVGSGLAPHRQTLATVTVPTVYAEFINLSRHDVGWIVPIRTATNVPGRPIRLAGQPTGAVAITPDGKTVYVTVADAIVPISTATGRPGRPIRIAGVEPADIVMNPDGKTAYVTGMFSNTVVPISTATNTPGKPFQLDFGSPGAMAFTPDGKTAYGITENSTVTPINMVTDTPGTPIRVGGLSQQIAITPDGKTAYVGATDSVIPINTATNTAGKPINIGNLAQYIAISPDGRTAYVGTTDSVIPINTATNTAGRPIHVGIVVQEILFTADGRTAYVAGAPRDQSGSVRPGPDTVLPISTATSTVGKPIHVGTGLPVVTPEPVNIAITLDGRTVYAASQDEIVPISTATNAPGKPIRVAFGLSAGIVIAP